MKRPPQIITKQEFENVRQNNIKQHGNEFKQGKQQFDKNSETRQENAAAAKKSSEAVSSIDAKYRQVIDVLDMRLEALIHNRDLILQQGSSLMDTELIDHMNRAREQCECEIDECSGQKAQVANEIDRVVNVLDELLNRHGSGANDMDKSITVKTPDPIAAIGSPSNTYNPNEPGAEDRAFDKALKSHAAAKFGVDVSVMKG